MTASQLAVLLQARAIGDGRWMARCPAHEDRTPSFSIGTGRHGAALLRCFAGCLTGDVLDKLGLSWKDVCGEGMTPTQARETAAAWQEQEQIRQRRRVGERVAFDRIRRLHAIADELGSRLANSPDTSGNAAVAGLFHQTLDKIRQAEAAVDG